MFIPENSPLDIKNLFNFKKSNISFFKNNFSVNKIQIFPSGRLALLQGLGYLNLNNDAKIWLPAYICSSVLTPIKMSGLQFNFYDVDEELVPKLNTIKAKSKDIILVVHYFGITQPIEKIKQYCVEKGFFLIEDCAHILPDITSSLNVGSFGDIAIFSLRKQLPVPDGAVLILNNLEAFKKLKKLNIKINTLSKKKLLMLVVEKIAFSYGINIIGVKKFIKNKLKVKDFFGDLSLKNEISEISNLTLNVLNKLNLNDIIKIKKNNYRILKKHLADIPALKVPFSKLAEGSVPKLFPLLVENPDKLYNYLNAKGIAVSYWPGEEKVKDIDFINYKGTNKWLNKSLFLPLNECLRPKHLKWMRTCIKEFFN